MTQKSFSGIKTIFLPKKRIGLNILPDHLVVLFRADHMVVVRALEYLLIIGFPVLVDAFGCMKFVPTNYIAQRRGRVYRPAFAGCYITRPCYTQQNVDVVGHNHIFIYAYRWVFFRNLADPLFCDLPGGLRDGRPVPYDAA